MNPNEIRKVRKFCAKYDKDIPSIRQLPPNNPILRDPNLLINGAAIKPDAIPKELFTFIISATSVAGNSSSLIFD